jgi:site-specific recombinase XerD
MKTHCGVLEPFVVEANEIFQASLSTNTWNSYENDMSGFNKFRKNYNLDVIWPPPVNHISSFIAFLAYNSYTTSTAKTYVSPSKNSTGIRQGHRSADDASFLNCSTCPREL